MRGKGFECVGLIDFIVAAPAWPTDCAAAATAPVSLILVGYEAVKSFLSSDASGNVLSELVVDNLGVIGGLIGFGLAIADVGLVT